MCTCRSRVVSKARGGEGRHTAADRCGAGDQSRAVAGVRGGAAVQAEADRLTVQAVPADHGGGVTHRHRHAHGPRVWLATVVIDGLALVMTTDSFVQPELAGL